MGLIHVVFALGMTLYMLVAIPPEERDLIAIHGDDYRRYKEAVPALVPGFGGAAAAPSAPGAA